MPRTGRITAWAGAILLLGGAAGIWFGPAQVRWSLLVLATGVLVLAFSLMLVRWNGNHPRLRAAGASGFYWRSLVLALLALSGTVVVNVFSADCYRRIDLTSAGLYSLSPKSAAVLGETHIPIQLLAFIRDPAAVESLHQLMQRYRSLSDQLEYRIVDPQQQPELARRYSVETPTQAVVQSRLGWHKVDILTPFQQWRNDNEQRITSAILKVGRLEPKKVYFVQGHGERDLEDGSEEGFRLAAEALRAQRYQVETLSLAHGEAVPEDADVVISAGPQIDFQPREAEALHAYLRGGGRLMILVDPLTDFSMISFLAPYGLALGHDLVLDESASDPGLGAIAPMAILDRQHPSTRPIFGYRVVFPRAQSVQRRSSALGYETRGLSSTSPVSWSESRAAAGVHSFDSEDDRRGPHFVAVAAAKSLTRDASDPDSQARIVLVGDSDFAANAYLGRYRNGDLFLLAVQWLAGDAEVLDIPPPSPVDRHLDLPPGGLRVLRWTLLLVLPFLPLLAGLWTWRRRAAEEDAA